MLYVHLAILALTLLLVLYSDHLGWQYMRGKQQVLNATLIRNLHYAVGLGLVGMVATGIYMSYRALPILLTEPVFLLKMFFVLVLVLNSFFIGSLLPLATKTPYAELSEREQRLLILSGSISSISWVCTIGVALLLFGWPSFL